MAFQALKPLCFTYIRHPDPKPHWQRLVAACSENEVLFSAKRSARVSFCHRHSCAHLEAVGMTLKAKRACRA
eukprot:1000634-Pleurochrysis_carterae.AAC.2